MAEQPTGDVMKRGFCAVLLLAASLACATSARAADSCAKNVLEALVANATSRSALVGDVAQSVPIDPPTCVTNYCEISTDKPKKVKVAIGAGISEAYARLIADGREEEAAALLAGACSETCDRVVVTAFAASQADTVDGLCETASGQGGSGHSPSLMSSAGASGIGGGASASKN